MLSDFIPLFLMMVEAVLLSFSLLLGARFLGPSRANLIKGAPYESGMDPIGNARERYSIKFYLVAMIFIVFDVEVVFMYPWAASFHEFLEAGAGLGVMVVITLFVIILGIGLLYDIKKGGLEFE